MVEFFPDAKGMEIPTLLFMMVIYGYILMKGSKLISKGSEMLLLIYGPGIVGGLLIPILGAIPDCAIILISGLGSGTKEEIQNEITVGVGTLVGSTVMVITIPWAIGVLLGRRDKDPNKDDVKVSAKGQPKVTSFSLIKNVVAVLPEIRETAIIMMISSVSYLIIQIPAFFYHSNKDGGVKKEAPFALAGFIVTGLAFVAYCLYQYFSAQRQEIARLEQETIRRDEWKKGLDKKLGIDDYQEYLFKKYDKDNNGYLDAEELYLGLQDLGLHCDRKEVNKILNSIDTSDGGKVSKDGKISIFEFKTAFAAWTKEGRDGVFKKHHDTLDKTLESKTEENVNLQVNLVKESEIKGEEPEEEEEEDSYWHLSDNQLKLWACLWLILGTAVCAIFSDPMVDVISEFGNRIKISPFYISFVVFPLASNASEIISGLIFASKKTTESISLTLATLHGAATMNSTLALCIFMSLIYFRQLSWSFSAEVISVIIVIVVVGCNALRQTIYLWQALIVFAMYPLTIFMVFMMKDVGGLD